MTYLRVCISETGHGKHSQQQVPFSAYWSSLSALFVVQKTGESGQHGTNGMQRQPHHFPARSLVSTFWKARFCEPGRFLKPLLVVRRPRTSCHRTCSCPGRASGRGLPLSARYKEENIHRPYATPRSCRPRAAPRSSSRHPLERSSNDSRPRSRPCSAARRSAGRCRVPPARAAAGDRPTCPGRGLGSAA